MVHRFLPLLIGGALVLQVAGCSKGSGGHPDGGVSSKSDGGKSDGGAGAPDAGCKTNDFCPTADYCDVNAGTCVAAKPCMANPSGGDPTGDNACAYQADFGNPDYCGTGNCYCDLTRGVCLPVVPPCGACQSDVQCGNDPTIFTPTGSCQTYASADGGAASKVCLPTHMTNQACPPGYIFGSGAYMGDCVPSSGECGKPGACSSDADCDPQGPAPVCNLTTGTCEAACSFNYKDGTSECPPNQVCHVDPALLTPSTNPNFGLGKCGPPCDADGGFQCPSGTACVADGPSGQMRCRPAPPSCIRDADCPPNADSHTLGDCNLSTLACVNGCSMSSQCELGYSCQNGGCTQESCVMLGGAAAACGRGQLCCGEMGGPSCPSGVGVGQCYDAPNPPWCAPCSTEGPVSAPPDDVQRPEPSWCAGGKEWQSCDPTVFAQCPAEYTCEPGPTFCLQDSDCGTNGKCEMVELGFGMTTVMAHACGCADSPSQCPAKNSTCQMISGDGGMTGVCVSNWCNMRFCFDGSVQ